MINHSKLGIAALALSLGFVTACEPFKDAPPKPRAQEPLVFIESGLPAGYAYGGDAYSVAIVAKIQKNELSDTVEPVGKSTILKAPVTIDPRVVLEMYPIRFALNKEKIEAQAQVIEGMTAKEKVEAKNKLINPVLPGVEYDLGTISRFNLKINYDIKNIQPSTLAWFANAIGKSDSNKEEIKEDLIPFMSHGDMFRKISFTRSVDSKFLEVPKVEDNKKVLYEEEEFTAKLMGAVALIEDLESVTAGEKDQAVRSLYSVKSNGSATLRFPNQFFLNTDKINPTYLAPGITAINIKDGFTFNWMANDDVGSFMSISIIIENEAYSKTRDTRTKFSMSPVKSEIYIDCVDDGEYALAFSEDQIASIGLAEGQSAKAIVTMTRYKPHRIAISSGDSESNPLQGVAMIGTGVYGSATVTSPN